MSSHRDRLKILVALSDKLWEDYDNTVISEEEYIRKMNLVKKEINNGFIKTLEELEVFTSELGYIVMSVPTKSFIYGSEKIIINKN